MLCANAPLVTLTSPVMITLILLLIYPLMFRPCDQLSLCVFLPPSLVDNFDVCFHMVSHVHVTSSVR